MDNTTKAPSVKVVTREEWKRTHRDFKCGDPRKGTAKMVYLKPGVGTVLGPVHVVDAPSKVAR